MFSTRFVVWAFSVVAMLLGTGIGFGQNYPSKPIRIVTTGAGGTPDFALRLITPGLSSSLGQQVIVDNRPSGFIPGEVVSKASPDGYTLVAGSDSFWIGPLLEKAPYDPVRDFSPITMTGGAANILVVHPSLPVKSAKELIALAKARPGALNYATTAAGSSSHLAGELLKAMAGINITRINYRSAPPAISELISGEVQMMFSPAPPAVPHVKSGRLRALAVTSLKPSTLFPGLPTIAASGVPDYESVQKTGIFAPAATPVALIKRLNHEIVQVLHTADVKEKFFNAGVEVIASSPEEFAAKVKSELTRLGKVIKDAGIGLK